ncbi:MAG: AsmA family protein [Planctomycetes bacterium]|nr:AsmA family protein [Planctomycetota bacterium]
MNRAVKIGLKVVLIIIAVLLAALVAGWLFINSIARTAIERGGTYALGVDTRVDSVSLGVLQGEARVDGITIANAEGFKTPHLMKTQRLEVSLRPGSLLEDTIQITRFEIDGLDLHLEQKVGSTNISALLDNIKKQEGPAKPDQPKQPGGKKLKVNRIVVRNVVAHVHVLPIGGNATTLDVKVPEIVLTDVTPDNAAGGVVISELVRKIVPAILAAVVEKCKGAIPDADLKQFGSGLGKVVEGIGTFVKEAGEADKKGGGGALEKIFGGKK